MLYIYKIIISIILGTIEGITEFLPISSTGHIVVISNWLNISNKNTDILKIFIQFGSAIAILIFFFKKITNLIKFKKKKRTKNIHILTSLIPTVSLGFIFYSDIKLLFNPKNIMYSLIFGGIFLIISEILKPKKSTINSIDDINLLQSFIIGCFESLCLYPGFSRSGATIGTAILLGIKRSVAIDFSFIISIPLTIGASFLDLIKNINNVNIDYIPYYLSGFFISLIISLFSIKKLIKILNKVSLNIFGFYRFILAGLIYFTN
ncbi:undecaprenyl-diphosphate phosphatase [Buchnera aphidicola (Aphis craccivora)]|uniref:Undecaprenyl-diphosphatase n=1 Tax=Buchnera aphidicola (Aphis craccivora) TaxID=466616 RepID=A0A4D6XR54_9GAMM|nr:undecaprenyl-diphosphate phosphatase [Buchnera aphidicola]QCI16331.1 undecaprenyl-diphosphate phosphatase [Buchnera aphidicola (Aphis craccivora)]QLL40475.1 undecaprenyl-diphosphate phosphatase [Buchnera aphidicola (Aphis craccivore)]WAI17846.1 MAG: undecaprenyl-diphosphate phosphatase [Buchnera aphidicola (Aphis craccivora)]